MVSLSSLFHSPLSSLFFNFSLRASSFYLPLNMDSPTTRLLMELQTSSPQDRTSSIQKARQNDEIPTVRRLSLYSECRRTFKENKNFLPSPPPLLTVSHCLPPPTPPTFLPPANLSSTFLPSPQLPITHAHSPQLPIAQLPSPFVPLTSHIPTIRGTPSLPLKTPSTPSVPSPQPAVTLLQQPATPLVSNNGNTPRTLKFSSTPSQPLPTTPRPIPTAQSHISPPSPTTLPQFEIERNAASSYPNHKTSSSYSSHSSHSSSPVLAKDHSPSQPQIIPSTTSTVCPPCPLVIPPPSHLPVSRSSPRKSTVHQGHHIATRSAAPSQRTRMMSPLDKAFLVFLIILGLPSALFSLTTLCVFFSSFNSHQNDHTASLIQYLNSNDQYHNHNIEETDGSPLHPAVDMIKMNSKQNKHSLYF